MSFRATVIGIARNTSILLFQQMLTWGSTLLLMLFLPRYLGPVEYGRLFLAGSFTEIIRILVGYGGHYLVTKEVSRDPRETGRVHMTSPLIVKPSHEHASVGIADASVVTSLAELRRRVRYIFHEFDQPALVEEYIDGRELNVAILGSKRPAVLPISEIDFSGLTPGMRHIVSYEAKWMEGTVAYQGTKGVCPARIPADVEDEDEGLRPPGVHADRVSRLRPGRLPPDGGWHGVCT